MQQEEKIKQELEEKFEFLKGAVIVKRANRVFVEVSLDKVEEVFSYIVKEMGFNAISAITGMDLGNAFGVIYHLKRDGRIILNLRVSLNREAPAVNTITGFFPCADSYERELVDLLGIQVNGLPEGNRYPLPDGWPKDDHPLRKDWKPKSLDNKGAQDA